MAAYSMVKCEECKKVYKDDQVKCPRCGLGRDVFDPPERKKGPGAQFREGGGLMGWARVYSDEPREPVFERQARFLADVIAMQQGNMTGTRQPWSSIWKRERYR